MAKKGLEENERKELTSETDDQAAAAGSQKKSNLGILMLIGVLLVGGAVAGLYFTGKLPFLKPGAQTAAAEKGKEGEAASAEGEHGTTTKGPTGANGKGPIFYNFPEASKFLVNLNTGGKQPTFLKVDVALELPSSTDLEAVNANLPRIQDMFNTYLRELRPSDLQGSAGIYRLREELLMRVNKAVAPAKVSDVLFKEIVVQ